MSTVVPFPRPASAQRGGWSQQELAEFYRVEAALIRAGIGIASEHGLSDEGEPWFVFCRPDGDAIIHFARIDGSYLIASEVLDHPVRGPDFRALIDQIAGLHPELLPIPAAGTGTRLVVHPAALLAALVAAAAVSLSSEDARAGELGIGPDAALPRPPSDGAAHGRPQPARAAGGPGEQEAGRKQFEALVLSAMIFAAEAVAGDHRAASAEPDLAPADPAGGAASRLAQGDAVPGSGTAAGSGSGASAAQPAVPTALGSGASQGGTAAAGRIDAAPTTVRADLPGDRPAAPVPEAAPQPPGFGPDVRPSGTTAEARATGTGTQPTATTARAETAATPEGPGAGTGAQRVGSSPAQSADSGAQARTTDAAQPDTDVGGARQPWLGGLAHTSGSRMPGTLGSRDADVQETDKGHGSRVGPAAGDHPAIERAGRGNGPDDGQDKGNGPSDGKGHGWEAGPTADRPQVEQASRGNGQGNSDSQGNGQGQGNGNGQGSGQGSGHASQAEPAAGEAPQSEQTGNGQGQGNGNGQSRGHASQAEPAAGETQQSEHNGQGQGNSSQAQPAARSEAGSGMPGHGNGWTPGKGDAHGSAARSEVAPAMGDDPQPGRADDHGHRAVPVEPSDQRGARARGAHGADTDSGAPAHASADPVVAGRADHGSTPPDGASRDAGPPHTEHARGGPSDGGRGPASDATVPFESPKGNPSDAKAHGAAAGDGAAHAPADPHAGPAGAQVMHPQAGLAPHEQNPVAADHGPLPKDGPVAIGDHPGPGTTPASSAQDAASADEHGRPSQSSAGHGPGRAADTAATAGSHEPTPYGADDGGISVHPRGPGPTASQSVTTSQADAAPSDRGRGKVADVDPAGDPSAARLDQGSAAAPPDQGPAAQPRHPSDGLPPGKIASAGAPGGSPGHAGPAPDPAGPPRAAIDAGGNLVFHADSQPATAPLAAPHGPDDPAVHPQVGLVGVSDHAHPVHDLYHHS